MTTNRRTILELHEICNRSSGRTTLPRQMSSYRQVKREREREIDSVIWGKETTPTQPDGIEFPLWCTDRLRFLLLRTQLSLGR